MHAESSGGNTQAMKIYMLLMLIGVIVGFSYYVPSQGQAKRTTPLPPDSAAA